jgi:hypothetical protein
VPAIPKTLTALAVSVDQLVPYGPNPRRGDLSVIVESLQRHGQYRPIVVRANTFEVLAGNHTLAAAKQLGWTKIAATFVDVSDDEAARIVLVDNRTADLAGYDDSILAELLSGLPDLDGTGYSADELETLLALHSGTQYDGDLDEALAAADQSAWPWVKVQLNPADYERFNAVMGDTDHERLLYLLRAEG